MKKIKNIILTARQFKQAQLKVDPPGNEKESKKVRNQESKNKDL